MLERSGLVYPNFGKDDIATSAGGRSFIEMENQSELKSEEQAMDRCYLIPYMVHVPGSNYNKIGSAEVYLPCEEITLACARQAERVIWESMVYENQFPDDTEVVAMNFIRLPGGDRPRAAREEKETSSVVPFRKRG